MCIVLVDAARIKCVPYILELSLCRIIHHSRHSTEMPIFRMHKRCAQLFAGTTMVDSSEYSCAAAFFYSFSFAGRLRHRRRCRRRRCCSFFSFVSHLAFFFTWFLYFICWWSKAAPCLSTYNNLIYIYTHTHTKLHCLEELCFAWSICVARTQSKRI